MDGDGENRKGELFLKALKIFARIGKVHFIGNDEAFLLPEEGLIVFQFIDEYPEIIQGVTAFESAHINDDGMDAAPFDVTEEAVAQTPVFACSLDEAGNIREG